MTTWPDITAIDPPRYGSRWENARWLVGHHPRMQELCERTGAVDDDEQGRWPDVDKLAEVIRAYDGGNKGDWVQEARAFGVMSGGEKRLLRTLATLSPRRVAFSVDETDGLDDEGHAFVRDWTRLILGGGM